MTVWIGIDPGLKGAIAFKGEGVPLMLFPMPVTRSGKGRDQYDLGEILAVLRSMAAHEPRAVLEKLQPMPSMRRAGGAPGQAESAPILGGTIANYNRGLASGVLQMALTALAIPYQLVAPRVWQVAMHAGTSGADTKQRSIIAAQRLFPGVDLRRSPRCRKPDDGFAEALLLAAYGERTHALQPTH